MLIGVGKFEAVGKAFAFAAVAQRVAVAAAAFVVVFAAFAGRVVVVAAVFVVVFAADQTFVAVVVLEVVAAVDLF